MTILTLCVGVLACGQEASLPESRLGQLAEPSATMVRSGAVIGYLARPPQLRSDQPAEVWAVPELTSSVRASALSAASDGVVVFAVGPDTAPPAAKRYLMGTSLGLMPASIQCVGARCP